MRKVKFRDYVDGKWIEGEGLFHQWGESFDQCGETIGKFTFAIVEALDGTVHEVAPHDLQFLDPNQAQ
jgi:hypothetical protein